MGLSSLVAAVALFTVVLILGYTILESYASIDRAGLALKERTRILEDERHTAIGMSGFNCTNITATDLNVTLYATNTGLTDMRMDCVDVYIDGNYTPHSNIQAMKTVQLRGPGILNPSETMMLSSIQNLPVGEHNATIVSCSGPKASGRFNASICGDRRCEGGEYCDRDNSSCETPACYLPWCHDGCAQMPIIDDIDTGRCDSSHKAAPCQSPPCMCNGKSACCGAAGSACSQNAQCCSGLCDNLACSAYP